MAVVDAIPGYRHGVAGLLADEGFDVVALDTSQLQTTPVDIVMLAVRDTDDWQVLRDVCPHHRVIAVLTDGSPSAHWQALAQGAAGVVARDAELAHLRDVVAATAAGNVLLPRALMQELIGTLCVRVTAPLVTAEEAGWLDTLSHGVSVHDLAESVGRPRRSMYRRLQQLRERLGVSTNDEAMSRVAAEQGAADASAGDATRRDAE